MVDACTYEVGENLLATDSGLLYDAKVMRVKEGKGKDGAAAEPSYFIHFNKWNTRWDRWVPASGLRKLNDEKVTLEELGVQLGVTKERVRQIEHKALQKLSDGVLRRARDAADAGRGDQLLTLSDEMAA